jgi:hypothetical protein
MGDGWRPAVRSPVCRAGPGRAETTAAHRIASHRIFRAAARRLARSDGPPNSTQRQRPAARRRLNRCRRRAAAAHVPVPAARYSYRGFVRTRHTPAPCPAARIVEYAGVLFSESAPLFCHIGYLFGLHCCCVLSRQSDE